MLRLEPGRLAVEVNSRKRATAVRRLIKQRLGGAARLEETWQEPFEDALKKALADREWPEKARAADERQAILSPSTPSCSARSRSTSPATTGAGSTWRSPRWAGRRRGPRS